MDRSKTWTAVIAALLATAWIALAAWPGYMTFDSYIAFAQMREGITQGYPPMVSYVWWLTDQVIPGQGGMFLLQVFCVFFGLARLCCVLGGGAKATAAAVMVVAIVPATLGPMLVVWKDIAFAGFLAIGASYAIEHLQRPGPGKVAVALIFLFLAAAYRYNSLPALMPFFALLSAPLVAGLRNAPRRWMLGLGVTGVLSVLAVLWVMALSTWRLPDAQRLAPPAGHHGWTMAGDLQGISLCAGRVLVPEPLLPAVEAPAMLDALKTSYFPQHSQLGFSPAAGAFALREAGFPEIGDAELQRQWTEAVRTYPGCFLHHRVEVLRWMLGMNRGPVFYVTDPSVFPNTFGLTKAVGPLPEAVVEWVTSSRLDPLARVWLFILVGTVVALMAVLRRQVGRCSAIAGVAVFFSAGLYLGVGMVLLPAADLRYQFWVVLAFVALAAAYSARAWGRYVEDRTP